MTYSTPAGITIEYDNAAGVLTDITPWVLTINDIDVESITEESRPFGVAWGQQLPIGVGQIPPVEISGNWNDAANGPHDMFAGRIPETPASTTRTLRVTLRTGVYIEFETWLGLYRRTLDKNANTKYLARLVPTGTPTEAP